MKVLKILALVFAILIGLVAVAIAAAGMVIPAERSFTNEIEINAPAEKVWQVIIDKAKYPEWQTNLTRIEVIDDRTWIEHPRILPSRSDSLWQRTSGPIGWNLPTKWAIRLTADGLGM